MTKQLPDTKTEVQRNHGRTRSEATPLFPLLAATRCLKAERVYLTQPEETNFLSTPGVGGWKINGQQSI